MLTNIIKTLENPILISTLLVIMFLISGINKIFNFELEVNNLIKKLEYSFPIEFYKIIILLVIILEILASIMIIYYFVTKNNQREAYYSTIALIIFTILATLVYHLPDFNNYKRSIPFWANISLISGLLLLAKYIK